MKSADFETFRQLFDEDCVRVLLKKGNDYAADDDRLANFKRLAERLGLSPIQIWGVCFVKRVDAILEFAKSGKIESEPIRERFVDAHNYLDLGLALVEEK